MKKVIKNGTVITPYRQLPNGSVVIEDGKIVGVHDRPVEIPDAEVIDAAGNYISPGFIDIHVHGGGGADLMDATLEAILQIAKTHAQYGTTSMGPTSLTAETEDLVQTHDLYEEAKVRSPDGAAFLGIRRDGPYCAMSQRGAQDPRYIRNPDPAEYEE